MPDKKRVSGLGRGLSALLEEAMPADANAPGVTRLTISDIHANPAQPRRHFNTDAMDELVTSVRAHGVLQPILVRDTANGRYEIVAGERRWRAAHTRPPLSTDAVHARRCCNDVTISVAEIETRGSASAMRAPKGQRRPRNVCSQALRAGCCPPRQPLEALARHTAP